MATSIPRQDRTLRAQASERGGGVSNGHATADVYRKRRIGAAVAA